VRNKTKYWLSGMLLVPSVAIDYRMMKFGEYEEEIDSREIFSSWGSVGQSVLVLFHFLSRILDPRYVWLVPRYVFLARRS